MVNFGPLADEIGSGVWGTPTNFNGFRLLAALLHCTPAMGVSQTLRRSTEGATYIRYWALAHILVAFLFLEALSATLSANIVICYVSALVLVTV